MGYVPASSMAAQCDNVSDHAECPAEPTKPEVLPWRTRLKTRLGDRLFRRGECGVQECSDEAGAKPVRPVQSAPLPAAPPSPPEKPSVAEKLPLPTDQTTDLQVPKANLSEPESKRPDLVME
ncbi:MAG: hypothetical protein WCB27_09295 [Thermoguttaceae bacterium]|jgi:hypothetical protein